MTDLAFFVLLAQHESFRRAAQELGVAPPTISKRLAAIEQRLGVRLMHRTTRRVSLTLEGEMLFEEGQRILDDVRALENSIGESGQSPRGLLRVHGTLGFGRKYLTPLVSGFMRRYPDVEVQLHLSDLPVNVIRDRFDLAVIVGEPVDSRLILRTVAFNRRILCAAPSYLARRGVPQHVGELAQHDCIVIHENEETFGVWTLHRDGESELVKVRGALSSNDGSAALAWALAGHGIVLRSEWEAAAHIRSGALLRVLPEWEVANANVVAIYPPKNTLSARCRFFIQYLLDEFSAHRVSTPDALGLYWR